MHLEFLEFVYTSSSFCLPSSLWFCIKVVQPFLIIESNVIPLLIGNFIMLPPPGVSSRLIVILEFVALF